MFKKAFPFVLLCLAACSSAPSESERMSASLSEQGKLLLQQGKASQARDMYLSAVLRDKENVKAWNGLGVSNAMMGKRGEARDAYNRALEIDPENMSATNNLAHLELSEGRAAAAVELLEDHADDADAPAALRENFAMANRVSEAAQGASASGAVAKAPSAVSAVVPAARVASPTAKAQSPKAVSRVAKAALKPAPKAVEGIEIDVQVMQHYADLGDYPTDGMARARVAQLGADENFPRDISVGVYPEVKKLGGTPCFSIRATGKEPKQICDELKPLHVSCVAR